jgi:hypothetical protein
MGREGTHEGIMVTMRLLERVDPHLVDPHLLPGVNLQYVFASPESIANGDDELSSIYQKIQDIPHFAHYRNRFVAHGEGQCFSEAACGVLDRRATSFAQATELKSGADTDFLLVANQRLAVCRCILKYSYGYAYHAAEERDKLQNVLFLSHQERLERFTETLSYVSENALSYLDRRKVVELVSFKSRPLSFSVQYPATSADCSNTPFFLPS